MINIINFDSNNFEIDEKSDKNIFIYYIGHLMIKDSKYIKIYSVNPLYLIFSKVNGNVEEVNGNKYLTIVPSNESKAKNINLKNWIKIRDLIRFYDDEKLWWKWYENQIKFELTLCITIEISTMKIVVRTIFHENNKYYSQQVFSDECVKNIKMGSKNEFKKKQS